MFQILRWITNFRRQVILLSIYRPFKTIITTSFMLSMEKWPKVFKEDLSLVVRSLKREITEEIKEREGRIQTGKSPISFSLYKRINEYILKEGGTDSIILSCFFMYHMGFNLSFLKTLPQFTYITGTGQMTAWVYYTLLTWRISRQETGSVTLEKYLWSYNW